MMLTLQEMMDIHKTLCAAEREIHNPGSARAGGYDLLAAIEDAKYRLTDAIERDEEEA